MRKNFEEEHEEEFEEEEEGGEPACFSLLQMEK